MIPHAILGGTDGISHDSVLSRINRPELRFLLFLSLLLRRLSVLSSNKRGDVRLSIMSQPAAMEMDNAFSRRLAAVRDDYVKKVARRNKDHEAYLIAKRNHPTPELNSRGEPQWNGSDAQKLLKELVASGGHTGVKPQQLWEQRQEYQVYSLQTFRDHIYQEERLLKFNNYLGYTKKRKIEALQY